MTIASRNLLLTRPPAAVANPFLTNLAAYWKFENNALDSSGQGNDLTNNNSASYAAGKVGQAASLVSASSQYFSHADNASLSMGDIDFTLAAWVNPTTFPPFAGIASKGTAGADKNNEFQLYVDTGNSNKPTFSVGNNTTSGVVVASAGISTGAWHLIIAWHDSVANTLNIQVDNGTPASAAYSSGSQDSSGSLLIGRLFGASNLWNGLIDEAAIWKRVLTAAERTALYNGGNGMVIL